MKKLSILQTKDKYFFYLILFGGLVATMLEVVGIGLIVPLISILVDQNSVMENEFIRKIFIFFSYDYQNLKISNFVILLIFIFLLKFAIVGYFAWIKNKFAYEVQAKLSRKIFDIYLNKNYNFFTENNTSQLIQDVRDEPSFYCANILLALTEVIAEILIVLGILSLLFFFNYKVTFIIFIISLLIIIIYKFLFKKKTIFWAQRKRLYERLSLNLMRFVFGSMIQIKISNVENSVKQKLQNYVTNNTLFLRKQMFMLEVPRILLELITIVLFLVFILVVIKYTSNYSELISGIGLYAVSAFKILPSLNRIITGIQKINFGKNSFNVIKNIFDNQNLDTDLLGVNSDKKINNFESLIHIKNLTFGYKTKKIFKNFNLTIKKGDVLGIKGRSGSGKTSLVNIMLGLYAPEEGGVYVDGVSIHEDIKGWQNLVGYASQNIYILDDTIKNNICFEVEEKNINYDNFIKATRFAGINGLIEELTQKENTYIGERGSRLSGGQLQRIALARAIYRFPQILVLDEVTSSLDVETEKRIVKSIEQLSRFTTIVMISHRDSSLKICNKIITLD